jgi:RHS repeat-associated protein
VNASGVALEDLQYEFNLDDEINKIISLAAAPLTPQSKAVGAADAANRIGQFGAASFGFDEEGQTTAKTDASGTTAYQWDARGRLTQATLPNGQVVSYGYDVLDRRVSRAANGVTTTFQHDGADVVIDRESSGTAYDYLNGLGVDDKLRQTGGAFGTFYFLQDHLGSTSALTSTGSALIEQQPYEAFGVNAGSARTRYGYTGRERDDLTGLMYYRARWFDPQQGRFFSEDPIGYNGGYNLYAYVENDPVSSIDPLGFVGSGSKTNKPNWKGGRKARGEPRTGPRIDDAIPQCNRGMSCEAIMLNIQSLTLSTTTRRLFPEPLDWGHDIRLAREEASLKNCMDIYAEKVARNECTPTKRDCKRYERAKERTPGKVPTLQPPPTDFPWGDVPEEYEGPSYMVWPTSPFRSPFIIRPQAGRPVVVRPPTPPLRPVLVP